MVNPANNRMERGDCRLGAALVGSLERNMNVYYIPYRITRIDGVKRPLGLPDVGYLRFRTYSELDALRHARERLEPFGYVIERDKTVVY